MYIVYIQQLMNIFRLFDLIRKILFMFMAFEGFSRRDGVWG